MCNKSILRPWVSGTLLVALFAYSAVSRGEEEAPRSLGTGFVISTDGWILTNAHVVKACKRVEIEGIGRVNEQRVDEANDLAVLRSVDGRSLPPIQFRKAVVRLGEDIAAVGYPLTGLLSDSVKITTGNVNALSGLRNDTRYLQISTPVQPGNSGGPVVDRYGLLVGITSGMLADRVADEIGVTPQNVNFAIRASVAELFLQAQGISIRSNDPPPELVAPSTADLAEMIARSVVQVRCLGTPDDEVGDMGRGRRAVDSSVRGDRSFLETRGHDVLGPDYLRVRDVSYAGCKAACVSDPACMGMTYNSRYRACFLKSGIVALIRNDDAVSAYAASVAKGIIQSDFTVIEDMDMPGDDYRRISRVAYLDCFVECVADKRCRAFAFVKRSRDCWLKKATVARKAAPGVVLGVK
jgi:serine protease Do